MSIVPNRSTPENRKFWDFVESTAKEVEGWPPWMRGLPSTPEKMVIHPRKEDDIMDEVTFKTQFVASFCATWCAQRYEEACARDRFSALENPPVEDALYLANLAWDKVGQARQGIVT